MTTGMMAMIVSLLISGKSGMVTNYDYSITTNGTIRDNVSISSFKETILPTEFKDDKEVYIVNTFGNDRYIFSVYEHGFGGLMVASGNEEETHNLFMQGKDYSIKG